MATARKAKANTKISETKEIKVSYTELCENDADFDEQEDYVRYITISAGGKTTILDVNRSIVSCGMQELEGICNLNLFEQYNLKETFVEIIKMIKLHNSAAFVMVSDNKHDSKINVHTMFDELAVTKSRWKKSPRSGNLIKVWMF